MPTHQSVLSVEAEDVRNRTLDVLIEMFLRQRLFGTILLESSSHDDSQIAHEESQPANSWTSKTSFELGTYGCTSNRTYQHV